MGKFRNRLAMGTVFVACSMVTLITFLTVGAEVERMLYPPIVQWRITNFSTEGQDVIIEGTMVKQRSCVYVAPPRARAENGVNLFVKSLSPTAGISWIADDEPQAFGPWRIRGAAGRELTFYMEHRCHPLWASFSPLGEVDKEGKQVSR